MSKTHFIYNKKLQLYEKLDLQFRETLAKRYQNLVSSHKSKTTLIKLSKSSHYSTAFNSKQYECKAEPKAKNRSRNPKKLSYNFSETCKNLSLNSSKQHVYYNSKHNPTTTSHCISSYNKLTVCSSNTLRNPRPKLTSTMFLRKEQVEDDGYTHSEEYTMEHIKQKQLSNTMVKILKTNNGMFNFKQKSKFADKKEENQVSKERRVNFIQDNYKVPHLVNKLGGKKIGTPGICVNGVKIGPSANHQGINESLNKALCFKKLKILDEKIKKEKKNEKNFLNTLDEKYLNNLQKIDTFTETFFRDFQSLLEEKKFLQMKHEEKYDVDFADERVKKIIEGEQKKKKPLYLRKNQTISKLLTSLIRRKITCPALDDLLKVHMQRDHTHLAKGSLNKVTEIRKKIIDLKKITNFY